MRAIDADALKTLLIDTLERIKEAPAMNGQEMHVIAACIMLDEMIDDAPTINHFPRQQWISVKDRLPEDNVMVLVCSNNGDGSHTIAITCHTNNKYGYNIVGWIEPWQYFFYNHKITHWMPLPEAPKEE